MPFHRIEKQIWKSIFLNLSIQYFWVEQVTKRGTTAGNMVLLNFIWVSLCDIQFSKEANTRNPRWGKVILTSAFEKILQKYKINSLKS